MTSLDRSSMATRGCTHHWKEGHACKHALSAEHGGGGMHLTGVPMRSKTDFFSEDGWDFRPAAFGVESLSRGLNSGIGSRFCRAAPADRGRSVWM